MRGKGGQNTHHGKLVGITPAYAGKRILHSHQSAVHQDHPRVCGEKTISRAIRDADWGSPPRMRGKEYVYKDAGALSRITPAYAGKSFSGQVRGVPEQDHPRVCGEKHQSCCPAL